MALTNLRNILNNVAGVRPSDTTPLSFELSGPTFDGLVDDSDFTSENFSKNLGYHFRVVRVTKNISESLGKFTLQINPQTLRQDEDFAIKLTPSQQGIFVQHQGSVIKELAISGTTGFHPSVGLGGITRNGVARGGQGVSGFEQFNKFRNFIANYVEAKKNPINKDLRLIFENPKDGDSFIIEPKKFTKERKTPQKTLYYYNAVFSLIGRFAVEFFDEEVDDLINLFTNLQTASNRAVNFLQDTEGTILASAELISSVSKDFTSTIIEPLRAVNSALNAFNQGVSIVIDLPRSTFISLRNEVKNLRENIAEVVGLDLSLYNSLTNRTSTIQSTLAETTYNHHTLLNTFRKIERGLNIVLSNNNFFGLQTLADKSESITSVYDTDLNIPDVTTAIAKTVLSGDTIQTIAARELGTAKRYKELVILNDLIPPYIASTSSEGVLTIGDTILIPNSGSENDSNIVLLNQDYPISLSIPNTEKQFGIDLTIDKNFDLIFTNTSDLDLLGGKENALQALRILLGLEKGSLKLFPNIGTNLRIGEKIREDIAFEVQQDLKQTILTNPKFADAKFKVQIQNGTFNIEGFVKLNNSDLGIPINVNVSV